MAEKTCHPGRGEDRNHEKKELDGSRHRVQTTANVLEVGAKRRDVAAQGFDIRLDFFHVFLKASAPPTHARVRDRVAIRHAPTPRLAPLCREDSADSTRAER